MGVENTTSGSNDHKIESVRLNLQLTLETDLTLEELMYGEAPYEPPEELEDNKELLEQHGNLVLLHTNLKGLLTEVANGGAQQRFDFVRELVRDYHRQLEHYREQCRQPFYDKIRAPLGLEKITGKEFQDLIVDMRRPLAKAEFSKDIFNDEQIEVLTQDRENIERERLVVLEELGAALDNIRFGYELTDAESSHLIMGITEYFKQRWRHEAEVSRKKPEEGKWMAMLGVGLMEAMEEGAEGSFNFGKESVFKKIVPGLDRADQFFMRTMNSSAEEVGKLLKARGVKVSPTAQQLYDMIKKSPFGSKFWERLLTIESPVTVLIFAYYLHTSSNKVKASMQFASFMAMSGASSAMLETLQAGMIRSNYAILKMNKVKNMRKLRKSMRWMRRLPGNPAIHFFVAIAVMMGCNEWIDNNIITPLDEAIPDGNLKHGAGGAMSVLSGESILNSAGLGFRELGISQRLGLSRFDPDRDESSFFSEEYVTHNHKSVLAGLDSRFFNTIHDWNAHVRSAIERETNPAKKKLWEAAIITDRGAWAKRKAATDVFPYAQYTERTESKLEAAIRETDNSPLGEGENLNLLDIATADTDVWDKKLGITAKNKDSGNYTKGRNDRAIEYYIDRSDTVSGRVHSYMKSLPEDSDLRKQWEKYLDECRKLAKSVVMYRHLDVYNKEQWTGDRKKMPDYVRDGLVESIVHEVNRDRLIRGMDGHDQTGAIKVEETPDFSPSALIAKGIEQFGETKKEIKQMGLLEHIRWSSMGTYAFGDPRKNMQNALSGIAQSADKYLSGDALVDAKRSLRKLALSSEISDEKAMRDSMAQIVGAMLKSNEKSVRPASESLSEYLELPEGVNVFYLDDSSRPRSSDLKQVTLGLSPYLNDSDILIFRRIDTGYGSTIVSKTHIDCGSLFPEEWTVSTSFAAMSPTAKGSRKDWGDVEKNVPLKDWMLEHPDLLGVQQNGKSAIGTLVERQRERVAEEMKRYRAFQEQLKVDYVDEQDEQDEAKERAKLAPDTWIPYPTQETAHDENDLRPSYEYVAYISGYNKYIYMQKPMIYRGKKYWQSASSHVVRKRGDSSYTQITYEEEYSGKGKNSWDRSRYKTEDVTDEKLLKDRQQHNAMALEVGAVYGNRADAIAEAKMIHALHTKGAHTLVYTHGAQKTEVDGHAIYTVSSESGKAVEFSMKDGRWVWRTKGFIKWDASGYFEDPKKASSPKAAVVNKRFNSIAREIGMLKGSELPLTSREMNVDLTDEQIGIEMLINKYGAIKITEDGETFYRIRGDQNRITAEYMFADGKWQWRTWGGSELRRITMDGDYVNTLERNKRSEIGSREIYQRGLHLPIEGNDRASIQKVLAVYVGSMESDRIIEVENHILRWYSALKPADRFGFLSHLEREMYDVTRGTKTDRRGFLYLDSVTYKTKDFAKKLTRYTYATIVRPALKKYMESIGYTFN